MLVSFNWLKEYIDLSEISADELAEKFTLGGLEVEALDRLGIGLDNLVVGEVLTSEEIENSDHLKMTTVDVAKEILPIVCGAPNVEVGQKVIVAKIGSILPGDFEIKETKIMGEVSKGMICSLDELGFSDSVIPKEAEEGIFVLPVEAKNGADARPYIGLDDIIFEFDLTPNRADALSMHGIAHEVAALLDKKASFDKFTFKESNSEKIEDYISVSVEDTEDTPSYKMRVVKDVTIGESPIWMQRKLMNEGMRPIDLVVDVTNYVMLEFGQPLHAFDYDKLKSKEIYVRRAKNEEKFTTLDDRSYTLTKENLVITDGQRPVALAGVMGGANSQITEDSTTIAIESAVFNPVLTRRTANKLNLRSEASSRFEKGINKATVQQAADLAAKLIAELGGGTIVAGTESIAEEKLEDVLIETTINKVNGLIGTSLKEDEISSILNRLGFEHVIEQHGKIKVYIPPRRWDIKIPEDLVEEIARIYGYNNIPITLPITESIPGELTDAQKIIRLIRRNLEGNGLQEAISYSLTTPDKASKFVLESGQAVSLQNPASEDRITLRQNLISGLLDDATYNQAHQVPDIALYEIGRIFYEDKNHNFTEFDNVAALLSGKPQNSWFKTEEKIDFYTIKGLVETLLGSFLFKDKVIYQLNTKRAGMHPGRVADIYLGDELLGYVGQIHPTTAKEYDLEDTFVFELSIDKIVKAEKNHLEYIPLNRYPGSSRDIALLVDEDVTHIELKETIANAGGDWLQDIHLFDLYAGDNIEEGKKSMAYSLYFANPNATLKESEVKNDFDRIEKELINKFNVEIR